MAFNPSVQRAKDDRLVCARVLPVCNNDTVCLVLVISFAMDNRSLCIPFTDLKELITMFPDKINRIPLYM